MTGNAYVATDTMDAPAILPTAPRTPAETGLPNGFLVELVAKAMLDPSLDELAPLARHLALPPVVVDAMCRAMRDDGLVEVLRRGDYGADARFRLTGTGRARALEWTQRNRYAGPAPVTLADYAEGVRRQTVADLRVTRRDVAAAMAGLVVPDGLGDQIGTAVNAGRPMLLHGPAGSGKTWLAARLPALLPGTVEIPHAIHVHGEVVRLFDEQWHRPVDASPDGGGASLDDAARRDARWVRCERPLVIAGGELTLEMLELSFDERAGFYEAPPHVKANGGVFIVDDLGRQAVTPRELMNRWIVPMDRRIDYLTTRRGTRFTLPFDMVLAFCGNLSPADLGDPAFLRRIGHKIHVGPLDADDYRQLFARACADEGVPHDAAAVDRLLHDFHGARARPPLACHPRDLLRLIVSRARYLEEAPRLDDEALEWAWTACFGPAGPGLHAVPAPTTDGVMS